MGNGNGKDYRVAVVESAIKHAPYAILLGLVLYFVGEHAMRISEELIGLLTEESSAIDNFATAIQVMSLNHEDRMENEERQHEEILHVFGEMNAKSAKQSERRDKEIELLNQILVELRRR